MYQFKKQTWLTAMLLLTLTACGGTTTPTAPVTPNSDATLSNLSFSNGTISPAFQAVTTSYTLSVAADSTTTVVTPTATETNATITVNGETIASGDPIATNLQISKTFTVIVTAANGTTTQTYTVNVKSLSVTPGDLVANAGPNQTLSEGAFVQMDASLSSGSSYLWSQLGGPTVSGMVDSNVRLPNFTAPFVDTNTDLVFQISVSNGQGVNLLDTVTISVIARSNLDVEDNNHATSPSLLEFNGEDSISVSGSVFTTNGDFTDFYSLTAPLNGQVTITLDAANLDLCIFDVTSFVAFGQSSVEANTVGCSRNLDNDQITVAASGKTYYIQVQNTPNIDSTAYTLGLTTLSNTTDAGATSEVEPNANLEDWNILTGIGLDTKLVTGSVDYPSGADPVTSDRTDQFIFEIFGDLKFKFTLESLQKVNTGLSFCLRSGDTLDNPTISCGRSVSADLDKGVYNISIGASVNTTLQEAYRFTLEDR
jgi:hypothetical protein